jgi:hypothetical protein
VLAWVAEGETDWEVSVILGRSARTVEKHPENIYRKLAVETRTAAATLGVRRGEHPVRRQRLSHRGTGVRIAAGDRPSARGVGRAVR